MRYALAAVAILLCGCGQQRTVLEKPAPVTSTDDFGRTRTEESPAVVAPVYDQPQRLVYLACLRAARDYFNGQTLTEDPPSRISLNDIEWNAGNMHVVIDIVPVDDQHTRVELMTEGYGANPPMSPESSGRRRMRNYLKRLDIEVRTLVELRSEASR